MSRADDTFVWRTLEGYVLSVETGLLTDVQFRKAVADLIARYREMRGGNL